MLAGIGAGIGRRDLWFRRSAVVANLNQDTI